MFYCVFNGINSGEVPKNIKLMISINLMRTKLTDITAVAKHASEENRVFFHAFAENAF